MDNYTDLDDRRWALTWLSREVMWEKILTELRSV